MINLIICSALQLQRDLDVDAAKDEKTPRRHEIRSGEGDFHSSPKDYFKVHYYEALDLVVNFIQQRFDQPGYEVYRSLQDLLIKAAHSEEFTAEFDSVVQFYGSDFDPSSLKVQTDLLHTTVRCPLRFLISITTFCPSHLVSNLACQRFVNY